MGVQISDFYLFIFVGGQGIILQEAYYIIQIFFWQQPVVFIFTLIMWVLVAGTSLQAYVSSPTPIYDEESSWLSKLSFQFEATSF